MTNKPNKPGIFGSNITAKNVGTLISGDLTGGDVVIKGFKGENVGQVVRLTGVDSLHISDVELTDSSKPSKGPLNRLFPGWRPAK